MSNQAALTAVKTALETTTHNFTLDEITIILSTVEFSQGATVKAIIEEAAADIGTARMPAAHDAEIFLLAVALEG